MRSDYSMISFMPKAPAIQLPKELLEQIYAEVEQRVEAKFKDRIDKLEARIKALERENEELRKSRDHWKKLYYNEVKRSEKLAGELSLANARIKELESIVEKQAVRIAELEKQLYGKKSEVTKKSEPAPEPAAKRARGREPGNKGSGRKSRTKLEAEECVHDLKPTETVCQSCAKPYNDMGYKVSEEVHIHYKLVRIIHKRRKMRRTCQCAMSPVIKTAPIPPKLFRGSLFSTEFWQYIIFDKYHLQRPMNRVRQFLESHGLEVSQGTLTNGLKRLHKNKVFKPIIEEITQRVRAAKQKQMDETSWKVFQEIEGKKGYMHWLWLTRSSDCCLFVLDPTRSREAAKRNIGEGPVVLTSDMLKAYENLGDNVINSWCWAHVRRYILKLASYKTLKASADSWLKKVDWLYHCNNQRLAAKSDEEFQRHDSVLRLAINEFERLAKSNAKRKGLHPEAKKVFSMIAKHWDGLALFVELPSVPMDNNLSEQALRNAVCGRKAYYGSGALWSGELAAQLFTIFSTLELNGINPRTWILEYLQAVADNNGQAPTNAAAFLPWNSPPVESLCS